VFGFEKCIKEEEKKLPVYMLKRTGDEAKENKYIQK